MNPQRIHAARPRRILIVDDEEDVLELLEFNLRQSGFQVIKAANGPEALACARRERPDLIVLDLMLPEMDGVAVCEILREFPETARTPILMLTAFTTHHSRLVSLQAGATDYLTKPFSPRDLIRHIHSLLDDDHSGAEQAPPSSTLEIRHLCIDVDRRQVEANGTIIELSHKEFQLLTLLVQAVLNRIDAPLSSTSTAT